jgi:hypothetical protein
MRDIIYDIKKNDIMHDIIYDIEGPTLLGTPEKSQNSWFVPRYQYPTLLGNPEMSTFLWYFDWYQLIFMISLVK